MGWGDGLGGIVFTSLCVLFLRKTEQKKTLKMPSSSVYFCGHQSNRGISAAPSWLPETPTVVGHLAVHRRVMILGGSDRRLVFGRPVNDR